MAVAPRAVGVGLGAELLGCVVGLAGRACEADFQAGRIADVGPVAPAHDEIQGVAFRHRHLAVVRRLLALAVEVDPAIEHGPGAVQDVHVGGRGALVDGQERSAERVVAGLRGCESHHAVLALGAGVERHPARLPADVGHGSHVRRGVMAHGRVDAAQLAGGPRSHARQRALLARRRAQQPLRVVLVEPRAGRDPLRLEPHQDLHPLGVGVIADRAQAAGKPLRIDFPRADLRPALLLHVPAGVHPPVVELELFLQVAVDVHDLVVGVGLDHLLIGPRAGGHELGRREPAAGLGHAVGHHPAAPEVLRPDPVAVPELKHDERAADLLAGQELQSRDLLARANVKSALLVAQELGRPLARPAHDDDHALMAPGEIEVRHVGVGRAPAGCGKAPLGARRQGRFQRPVIGAVGRRADGVVQQELAQLAAIETDVEGLDVLQDRRVGLARVAEAEGPFHRGEVLVQDGDPADFQSGSRIAPDQRVLEAVLVELPRFLLQRPRLEEIGRRLAVVDERKGQVRLVARNPCGKPFGALSHFLRRGRGCGGSGRWGAPCDERHSRQPERDRSSRRVGRAKRAPRWPRRTMLSSLHGQPQTMPGGSRRGFRG